MLETGWQDYWFISAHYRVSGFYNAGADCDPGLSTSDENQAALSYDAYQAQEAPSVKDTEVNIFPANPIQAMAEGKCCRLSCSPCYWGWR